MCGIFGIAGHPEASNLVYLGLYSLQHRGQEAAGIVSTDGNQLFKFRRRGLVSETFTRDSFRFLRGSMAIGHVRYSTTGNNNSRNVQPFIATGNFGHLSIAHNGNLTNFEELKTRLEKEGAIFQSTMDTELILHLAAKAEGPTMESKIKKALSEVTGAYSLLLLTEKELIAVRDPKGFRPLCLGWLQGFPVFSSETCAFDLIGASFDREMEPGEFIVARPNGEIISSKFGSSSKKFSCIFEHIYFARPDSNVFDSNVYQIRKQLGHELAKEHSLEADLVMPVPDSGMLAGLGYSEESKIPYQFGLIRNHYVGRTFIEPERSIRGFGVKIKLNAVKSVLAGKRVILVDDSIVRGTTSKKIIKMVRDAGAKQVMLLISSPPFVSPCFYGIDTPTKSELIASSRDLEGIRDFIGVDYLGYLSLEGLYRSVTNGHSGFCDACFTKNYPTAVPGLKENTSS